MTDLLQSQHYDSSDDDEEKSETNRASQHPEETRDTNQNFKQKQILLFVVESVSVRVPATFRRD